MKKIRTILLFGGTLLSSVILLYSCFSNSSNFNFPEKVTNFDILKYTGKWYEIARFPHRFEKDLTNVTAEYTLLENGEIKVVNSGIKNNKIKSITGKAWIPDKSKPFHLKVSFFWPFSADYYVTKIDENYQYALVTSNSKNYLWILARNPYLDDDIYKNLLNYAKNNGYDISKIIKVKHNSYYE